MILDTQKSYFNQNLENSPRKANILHLEYIMYLFTYTRDAYFSFAVYVCD